MDEFIYWLPGADVPQTNQEFFDDLRAGRARSGESDYYDEFDKNFPGWYDEWKNASYMTRKWYLHREAMLGGLALHCDCVKVFEHPHDSTITFKNVHNGRYSEILFSGTDQEKRSLALAARDHVHDDGLCLLVITPDDEITRSKRQAIASTVSNRAHASRLTKSSADV